jgi:hypothetical protein
VVQIVFAEEPTFTAFYLAQVPSLEEKDRRYREKSQSALAMPLNDDIIELE